MRLMFDVLAEGVKNSTEFRQEAYDKLTSQFLATDFGMDKATDKALREEIDVQLRATLGIMPN